MPMTRAESLAKARAARSEKAVARRQGPVVTIGEDRDLLSLRAQVGRELARVSGFGASGLRVNLGDIDEEYVPELKSLASRTRILERMGNDPIVSSQLRRIWTTIISGVRWSVEGGKKEHQDLIKANLLRQGPRGLWNSSCWEDFLFEVMGCLLYGFALFGKSVKQVDGLYVYSDLKWLHPRSVRDEDGWNMEGNDTLLSVRRQYTDATMKLVRDEIAADDLFIVPWDRRGPNWEGVSYIRPMYRPWKERDLAGKIWLIDLQNRGVGIPLAKLSGLGGPKEKETLVEILKSLRGGSKERAFVVIEKDEDVKFLTSEGQVADSRALMDTKRMEIAGSGGTEAFQQGQTDSGSRASASALLTPFFIDVNAIKIRLEAMINYGAGPLPGLVEWIIDKNYGPVDEMPRIVGSKVSPTEQLDNVPLLTDAIQKQAIPTNITHANEIARKLGYSELTQAQWDQAVASKAPQLGGGAGRPPEIGPRDNPQDPRDDTEGRRYGLQEGRSPRPLGETPPTRKSASWPWLSSTRA